MPRPRRKLTLTLPDAFIALCGKDGVMPEIVLRGFIADLCELQGDADQACADGYACHGLNERFLAREYYVWVGYARWNK